MGLLRPDFAALFRKGARQPGRANLAVPPLTEDAGASSEAVAGAILGLFADPPKPQENEAWFRADKNPPELRLYAGGQTWALAFAAVEPEPPEPLVPDVGLAPPLVPETVAAFAPPVPDVNLAPPLRPEGV